MAKKTTKPLTDIFKPKPASTQPAQAPTGRTVSVGVGLKESEVGELDRLAGELGIARNELMGYALRRFLADVRAKRIDLQAQMETTTRRRLRNP